MSWLVWLGVGVYALIAVLIGRESGRNTAWSDRVDILGHTTKVDTLNASDISWGVLAFFLSGPTWILWMPFWLLVRSGLWGTAVALVFAKPRPPKHLRDAALLAERDKRIVELEREVGIR